MTISVYLPHPIPRVHPVDMTVGGRPCFIHDAPFPFYLDGVRHVVPIKFITDCASVPKGLWNTFYPGDPLYIGPADIHDWLYEAEFYPQRFCDEVFNEFMRARVVPDWKRRKMYLAVRLMGWTSMRKHTQSTVIRARSLLNITEVNRPLFNSIKEYMRSNIYISQWPPA